jgi:diadenosine tetraphosphate (Ap4A) HIT family hydrolase
MASLFSRIVQKELFSYGILKSEKFVAFLDIRRLKAEHTLVVPKSNIMSAHFFPGKAGKRVKRSASWPP